MAPVRYFPTSTPEPCASPNGSPTYLGFDMGIGKTRTFIEAVHAAPRQARADHLPGQRRLGLEAGNRLWHPFGTFVIAKAPGDLLKPVNYTIVSHGLMSQKNGDGRRSPRQHTRSASK